MLVVSVIWLMASTHSFADKVVLNDGDVIEGVVTRQDRNSIVLEHSDLGRMEISRDRIASSKVDVPNATVELAGGDFNWDIARKQKLTCMSYYFHVVGDLDDYRARISGEWRFIFDKYMNLNFLIGTLYEYTSLIDPDKDHRDMRTYLGLRFSFNCVIS